MLNMANWVLQIYCGSTDNVAPVGTSAHLGFSHMWLTTANDTCNVNKSQVSYMTAPRRCWLVVHV